VCQAQGIETRKNNSIKSASKFQLLDLAKPGIKMSNRNPNKNKKMMTFFADKPRIIPKMLNFPKRIIKQTQKEKNGTNKRK